jgi:hypothetical protein
LASKEGLAAKLAVSLLAIPTYAISLPFLYLAGDHLFMKSLIRLCDHVGRVTAAMGLNLVSEIYITR